MYFIGEIPNEACKISLYKWNNKYFVKFETPDLEQTFKISEMDVVGEGDVREMMTDEFIQKVVKRFEEMYEDLSKAMNPY
ncbi:hypothetical protein SAMN04515674_101355 [Pseudarcicella hirudinis]|uniref:Activator of Hsp90 ATPase homolog 1-like protein n=1 Tax=Pseudarcicella hirudinis TaxID=1079859 RepID=A0A1I5MKW6_9BACT|nr:hypothetical protein [Pseudarcicella hirudinis]SFP10248.1 hypothetical protein SAMN04515674_101355 [Pseudarcicella hirudinis]